MNDRIAITELQKSISKKINEFITRAIHAWESYNTRGGMTVNRYDYWYNKAEKLAQEAAKEKGYTLYFDYPGLYPTFQLSKDNQSYTEYNTESFFKRINGFWDF